MHRSTLGPTTSRTARTISIDSCSLCDPHLQKGRTSSPYNLARPVWTPPQQKEMARVVPDTIHLHKHVTDRVASCLTVARPAHLDTYPKCPNRPSQYHLSLSNSWQTGLCTFFAIICLDVGDLHRSQIKPVPSHSLNWASLLIPLSLHPTQ